MKTARATLIYPSQTRTAVTAVCGSSRTVPAKAGRDGEAAKPDNQAGDRPGDRHPEFCFRVGGIVLDLRNTAEREQGDRLDFQPAGLGHQRMGEFMQQQGDEEQDSGEQRSDPDLARAPIRVDLAEVFAEGEHDQGSDDEPAIMKPDLDSRDSSQFDVGVHLPTPQRNRYN